MSSRARPRPAPRGGMAAVTMAEATPLLQIDGITKRFGALVEQALARANGESIS